MSPKMAHFILIKTDDQIASSYDTLLSLKKSKRPLNPTFSNSLIPR